MKKLLILFSIIFVFTKLSAQPYKTIKPYAPYKWMIGVSWTAIDDDGRKIDGLFDYATSLNYLPYPTRVSLDRYFRYGWSAEASATYMTYLPGKLVQDTIGLAGLLFSFDVNGKYSFYTKYAPRARWIEPYLTFGVGYTYRSNALVAQHVPTLNLGLGLNFWFTKNIGIQLNSSGKFGIYPGFWDSHTSYFQHSAGIVFRFKSKSNNNNDFHRPKNKWTKENRRYKQKGGH